MVESLLIYSHFLRLRRAGHERSGIENQTCKIHSSRICRFRSWCRYSVHANRLPEQRRRVQPPCGANTAYNHRSVAHPSIIQRQLTCGDLCIVGLTSERGNAGVAEIYTHYSTASVRTKSNLTWLAMHQTTLVSEPTIPLGMKLARP